jgi:hypothetical protein
MEEQVSLTYHLPPHIFSIAIIMKPVPHFRKG